MLPRRLPQQQQSDHQRSFLMLFSYSTPRSQQVPADAAEAPAAAGARSSISAPLMLEAKEDAG
jgi:hypothetical protein